MYTARLGIRRHILSNSFHFTKPLGHGNSYFQSKMSHRRVEGGGGGGVRKSAKKCHVLFEWPLNKKRVQKLRQSLIRVPSFLLALFTTEPLCPTTLTKRWSPAGWTWSRMFWSRTVSSKRSPPSTPYLSFELIFPFFRSLFRWKNSIFVVVKAGMKWKLQFQN